MTLSRDIDGSIWKSSFLNRRYLRPRTKSKFFKVIFFLCDPKSTKNSWNLNGKAKFCIKSFVRLRLSIFQGTSYGTFLNDEAGVITANLIGERLQDKFVAEFEHMSAHSSGQLTKFLDFIRFRWVFIKNDFQFIKDFLGLNIIFVGFFILAEDW